MIGDSMKMFSGLLSPLMLSFIYENDPPVQKLPSSVKNWPLLAGALKTATNPQQSTNKFFLKHTTPSFI